MQIHAHHYKQLLLYKINKNGNGFVLTGGSGYLGTKYNVFTNNNHKGNLTAAYMDPSLTN